jgi:demethylphylloquinone reductase
MQMRVTAFMTLRVGAPCFAPAAAAPPLLRPSSFLPTRARAVQARRSHTRAHATAVLRPRVAVVGGGFGGLSAALKLAALPWTRLTRPEITLVDRADRFAFLPMMYELATGEADAWQVAPKFETLLADHPTITFVHASAHSLSLVGASPTLHVTPCAPGVAAAPYDIPFDRAILALGCEAAPRAQTPGAAEHAVNLHSYDDAVALKDRLDVLVRDATPARVINVVVVGGGYSGVETASCIAERLGSAGCVVIVHRGDRLLARGTDFNRLAVERALTERGVAVEYGRDVSDVTEDSVKLVCSKRSSSGNESQTESTLAADLVVWTTGVQPASALASLGVPLDDVSGLVATDGLLQVVGHEDMLFALGDGAAIPKSGANGGYAGTAQVAAQQAEYAAWNCWASLTGRPKLEYRYVHLGEMLVLGARDASVSSPLGVEIDGAPAWAMRRAAYLARMPTDRHRAKLIAGWATGPVAEEVRSKMSGRRSGPSTSDV